MAQGFVQNFGGLLSMFRSLRTRIEVDIFLRWKLFESCLAYLKPDFPRVQLIFCHGTSLRVIIAYLYVPDE